MKNQRKRLKNPRIRSDGYAKDIVYSLEIDRIRANTAQPRRDFDIESIVRLADSIRRYGILQPLSVRRVAADKPAEPPHENRKKNIVADVLSASLGAFSQEESSSDSVSVTDNADDFRVSRETYPDSYQLRISDAAPTIAAPNQDQCSLNHISDILLPELPILDRPKTANVQSNSPRVPFDTCQYELVAGERRLRAAKMLGLRYVPCIIVDVNDAISAELALVENMLRENLNMFEQASAFAHLAEKYSLTQEEIAAKMSLSQSAVANKIRLLKLSESERELIMDASLTERHARAFLRIPHPSVREDCIRHVIDAKLNVSDTDKYISATLANAERPAAKPQDTATAPTPEKLCSNIYKFISRMQNASGNYLTVNRKSDDKNVIITLTVRKGS